MNEWKRIFVNKKICIFTVILIFLYVAVFYYQANDSKTNTIGGEELERYIEEYNENIATTKQNAIEMLSNPLFSDKQSFVYRNLLKTKEDFSRIENIKPEMGNNSGVVALVNYGMTGFIVLIAGMFIVTEFNRETRKGLYLLTRSTAGGREGLAISRALILTTGITLTGGILFLLGLFLARIFFGELGLQRPIQSVPELSGITLRINIGEYLFLNYAGKILGVLLICFIFYMTTSFLKSKLSAVIVLLLFIGEYLAHSLIIPTDNINALKYINIYSVIFSSADFGQYYNLNFAGNPVPIFKSTMLIFTALFCLLFLITIIRQTIVYPENRDTKISILAKIKGFIISVFPNPTPFLWECKKVFFTQKGLIILIAVFYMAIFTSQEQNYVDFRNPYRQHWYAEYNGEVDSNMVEQMEARLDKMEHKLVKYEASLERHLVIREEYFEKGYDLISVNQTIYDLEKAIREIKKEITGLKGVYEKAKGILDYSNKTGVRLELIETTVYEQLFRNDYRSIIRNDLYLMIAMVLILSGINAVEKISNMEGMLHTLYLGQKSVHYRKLVITFVTAVVATIAIHSVQLVELSHVYRFNNLGALVQSVSCMRSFPLHISIQATIVTLFVIRIIIAFGLGRMVMLLSSKLKNRVSVIGISFFILIVPITLLENLIFMK